VFDGERFSSGAATVLVDDGRIVAVEPGFPDVGEQWQVVESDGATVLPGMIDAHVHLIGDSGVGALGRVPDYADEEIDAVVSESLRRQLAAGVTTVRDLGDRRYNVVQRRDRQRVGGPAVPEPTIVASGPPLTSPGGHTFYLGGEVDGRPAIVTAVRDRAERNVDVVKVMTSGGMTTPGTDVMRTQFSTDDLRFLVEQVHSAGLQVTAHAHGLPAVQQSIEVGVDGIEHCTCLTENGFELPEELVRTLADSGIPVSGVIPPPPPEEIDTAPPAIRELAARIGLPPGGVRALRSEMISRMHRAGTPIVTGQHAKPPARSRTDPRRPASARGKTHVTTPREREGACLRPDTRGWCLAWRRSRGPDGTLAPCQHHRHSSRFPR
jgi:imidazolonepropionase-like amidohydrolase